MKHPERIVIGFIWVLIVAVIAAEIYVNIKYGKLPLSEVPSWVIRFLIAR